jgi:PKD repeat protein/ribosomal protein L40E
MSYKLKNKKTLGILLSLFFLTLILPFSLIPQVKAPNAYFFGASGPDDGYWFGTAFYPATTNMWLSYPNYQMNTWFRFVNLNIPEKAIINNAYLYLFAAASHTGSCSLQIQAFDQNDASAPTSYSDYNNRPKTSASVSWTVPNFNTNSPYAQAVTNIVQEVVNRDRWESGNDLVLCLRSDTSDQHRYVYTLEAGTTYRPRLYITWTIPVRDVAITSLNVVPSEVEQGDSVTISVGVANEGQITEEFSVRTYYGSTQIGSRTRTLNAAASEVITFDWDTSSVAGGSYTIKATVSQVSGETDLADNEQLFGTQVRVIEFEVPIAAFTFSPTDPTAGQTVTFDASDSDDADGTIEQYDWDFGDESTGDGEIVEHTYSSSGTYEVTLTVTDNDDKTSSTTQSVEVGKTSSSLTISSSKTTMTIGEETTISGSLTPSLEGASIWLEYSVDETWTTIDSASTTSDGSYSYTWEPPTIDDYKVRANFAGDDTTASSQSQETSITVQPEPQFRVSNLQISPDEASTGEEVSVSVEVENIGEVDATYTVVLEINGVVEDQKDVSLAVGAIQTVTFKVTKDEARTFNVDVDGRTGSFDVAEPFNWTLVIGGVALIGAIAAVVILLLRKKKPKAEVPKPTSIKVSANPIELLADGRSTSTITVELIDDEGNPMEAHEDIEVLLSTTLGKVASPVKVSKGETTGKAILTSSTEFGDLKVNAVSRGLKSASVALSFVEKKRYCMHCGTRMPLDADVCPKCRRSPPSGVDVKVCKNCGEVIPIVAEYCSACGANQPKEKTA